MPPIPFKLVRVLWLDAYSEDAWADIDRYELEEHPVETVGWIVKETKKYILVAASIAWNGKGWEGFCMAAIPRKMIEEGPTIVALTEAKDAVTS